MCIRDRTYSNHLENETECQYNWECDSGKCCTYYKPYYCAQYDGVCIIPGRPFTAYGVARVATSKVYNIREGKDYAVSWKRDPKIAVPANNPRHEDIGHRWLKIAEAEHASVASFARFTLQLLSLGSPSELLVSSQKAEIDEINHAKYAYTLSLIHI